MRTRKFKGDKIATILRTVKKKSHVFFVDNQTQRSGLAHQTTTLYECDVRHNLLTLF